MKESLTMLDNRTGKTMDLSRYLPWFAAKGIEPGNITGYEALGTDEGNLLVKFRAGDRSVVIEITAVEFECLFSPNAIQ